MSGNIGANPYYDSKPGTLNDFLTALDEDDLKPDVVKRFEEIADAVNRLSEQVSSDREKAEAAADAAKNAASAALDNTNKAEEFKEQSRKNAEIAAGCAQMPDSTLRMLHKLKSRWESWRQIFDRMQAMFIRTYSMSSVWHQKLRRMPARCIRIP